jgi:hypothetical protein
VLSAITETKVIKLEVKKVGRREEEEKKSEMTEWFKIATTTRYK